MYAYIYNIYMVDIYGCSVLLLKSLCSLLHHYLYNFHIILPTTVCGAWSKNYSKVPNADIKLTDRW